MPWVSYPFTLFTLESNANDTLVAAMVLAALLAASYGSALARFARGGFAALAALTQAGPDRARADPRHPRPARAVRARGGSSHWRCSRRASWCSARSP